MGTDTKIEWTDHTFNPWIGCTKVSPGCVNCYAKTRDDRKMLGPDSHWGPGAPRHITSQNYWKEPYKWARQAQNEGKRHKVFTASQADIFDAEAPVQMRRALWGVIASTFDWLEWQIVTKRPQRIRDVMKEDGLPADFFAATRCWLIVSTENQEYADIRIPLVLQIPAAVHGISAEPLLGPINVQRYLTGDNCGVQTERAIRVSGSSERRSGDYAGRNGMENSQEAMGSLAGEGNFSTMQTSESGEGLRGISSGHSDDRRSETIRTCSSFGLSTFEGTDTYRPDSQSRGRAEETESPRQSDPRNDIRADASRDSCTRMESGTKLSWVIVGGESGHGARPMHPDWARSLRDQCVAAGVPFFFKQWGQWHPIKSPLENPHNLSGGLLTDDVVRGDRQCLQIDGTHFDRVFMEPIPEHAQWVERVGKKAAGALLDGQEWKQFPEARQ